MIITFEGGEGVGKTTQAALLKAFLESQNRPVVMLREPGGSVLSEKIRSLVLHESMDTLTELLLILSGRRENIATIIEPALAGGSVVVIDRFIDSTLVYQGIAGGIGIERVRDIMQATRTWLIPDLTFVLDLDPALAATRYTPDDRFEFRDPDYHRRLREGFVSVATEPRHRLIDTSAPIQAVFETVRQTVAARL
ncbi:MAG TPA: dTMP kinase [Deltaproteobacteria bacterium]|nr:dTMP kinase [Deltaproteobacteria bacterium]